MRFLKILLPLLALLIGSVAAQAQTEEGGYTLTTRCVPTEAGTTHPTSSKYEAGASIAISCNYTYTSFRFIQWEDESGTVVSTEGAFYYTMPDHDVTLIARFEYNPESPPEPSVPKPMATVHLDISPAESGYVYADNEYVRESSDIRYEIGSTASLSASGYPGFSFVNWTENGEEISTSATLSFTVEEEGRSITANFAYDPSSPGEPEGMVFYRKLSLKANPAEAAYSFSGSGDYVEGSSTAVSVSPNEYYVFDNWTDDSGNVVSTERSFEYTIPGRNVTLTANFHYDYNPSSPDEPESPSIDDLGIVGKPRMTMQDSTHVLILCSTPGATIHYTIDGTEPTIESSIYTEPVFVPGNIVVKAIAVKEGMTNSAVSTYQVKSYTVDMPVIAFDHGKIKMTSATPGATIRYTTDDSDPTAASQAYSEPIDLRTDLETEVLVKAFAMKEGMTDSDIAVYVFMRGEHIMQAPVFSLNADGKLVITPSVAGGFTHYTLDGTDPVSTSPIYTEPITLTQNGTVKAYTTHVDYYDSPVAEYKVEGFQLPTPTASYGRRALTLTCEDTTAGIHYTTDGSAPNEASTIYSAPIPLSADCIVRFIATKSGYNNSDEASFDFILAEWQEAAPTIAKDFYGRRIIVENPIGTGIRVSIDGEERICASRDSIDVTSDMRRLEAVAFAANDDRYDSEAAVEVLVFHLPPALEYDGHSVHYGPADDDPEPERAEASIYLDGVMCDGGTGLRSIDMTCMARLTAVMSSDRAFRSDSIAMDIDYFNTGRNAAARNGHSLSECFGTWGDTLEDYTYLCIGGEVEKKDLELLGSLPNLTTLHLEPYRTTTEACDNVLAGSRIETLFAVNIPQGMLKGMPRLATVIWGVTNERMPEGRLSEAGNPNILLWVTDEEKAPADAVNVVTYPYVGGDAPTDPEGVGVRGTARHISLQAGYPFSAHMPIEVDSIELTKEFSLPTPIGDCGGWESLVLPFDVKSIRSEKSGEIVPFKAWSGSELQGRPFWLYRATESGWESGASMEACVPYLLSMPNNSEYTDDYIISGKVTFAGQDVTLGTDTSMPKAATWLDGIEFVGTFMPVEDTGIRSLNVKESAGYGYLGSAFVADGETLPFGAYIKGMSLPGRVAVFGDWSGVLTPAAEVSGVMVETPAPGVIRVSSSRECHTAIVTPEGSTVRSLSLKAGESVTVDGLTRGLYIVAGCKVMVK